VKNIEIARYASIRIELEISGSVDAVWKALTENIGEWWPDEFYAGGTAGARTFEIEQHPGGRMFETWGEGGGLVWGNVATVEPNKRLQIVGHIFPNWGGPVQCYNTWELEQDGNITHVKFDESSVGRITEDGTKEKDKGWRFLIQSLKAHVEKSKPPAWKE